MIATKYFHLIALGVVIGGWGAPMPLDADIALDGVPSAHHTTSTASSVDATDSSQDTGGDTPTPPVSSHRKKRKSTATTTANDAAAPTGKTSDVPAAAGATGTGSPAVAKTTKKKKHAKAVPASDSDAEMTGEKPPATPTVAAAKPPVTRPPATVSSGTNSSVASAPATVNPTVVGTAVPQTAIAKTGRKKKHGKNATGNASTAIAPAATPIQPTAGKLVPGGAIVVAPSAVAPRPSAPAGAPLYIAPAPVLGPTVQTGLPVARPGTGTTATLPIGLVSQNHLPRPGSTSTGSYPPMTKFPFTDYPLPVPRTASHSYPWKSNIITTVFWIGEGGSPLSATTNYAGAWNMEWMHDNGGSDDPDDQDGYAQRGHASTLNPFYVALPFNDLVYPDKARRWIPASWFKPNHEGKPVSACQNRWVEIKNWAGRTCYAQWEDVGPLRYDHAEYVFGPERPDTLTHAGLDVSPAVARYLGIDKHGSARTSWKFVDDSDVQPGMWLKYDEQAILYRALIDQERHGTTPPIQDMEQPTPDDQLQDTNRKKAGAARG